MAPRRRKKDPIRQRRPTFQDMLKRHQSGLDMTQEYGRRREDPPAEKDETEFEAFSLLERAYRRKYELRRPKRKRKPKNQH
jgi:hypothetical protein